MTQRGPGILEVMAAPRHPDFYSPSPDFQVLFESVPGLYLVLTPGLKIAAVSGVVVISRDDTERKRSVWVLQKEGVVQSPK